MPRLTRFRLLAPCALAACLFCCATAAAAAKTVPWTYGCSHGQAAGAGRSDANTPIRWRSGPIGEPTASAPAPAAAASGWRSRRHRARHAPRRLRVRPRPEAALDHRLRLRVRPRSLRDRLATCPGLPVLVPQGQPPGPQISGDQAKVRSGGGDLVPDPVLEVRPSPPYYCPPSWCCGRRPGRRPAAFRGPRAQHQRRRQAPGRPPASRSAGPTCRPTDGRTQVALTASRHIRAAGSGRIPSPRCLSAWTPISPRARPSGREDLRLLRCATGSAARRGPIRISARGGATGSTPAAAGPTGRLRPRAGTRRCSDRRHGAALREGGPKGVSAGRTRGAGRGAGARALAAPAAASGAERCRRGRATRSPATTAPAGFERRSTTSRSPTR